MNYKFIENINKEEYEDFVENHPTKSHFMQSYYFGQINRTKGFIPHYVGMKEKGKIVATALLLQKNIYKNICYFYCPRGYVLNYDNLETLTQFSNFIKQYTKKRKSFFTIIDPDVQLQKLDIEGNVIDGINNFPLIKELKKLGYRHLGFNTNFENREPRFTFRLSLTPSIEEIHKNMHSTTRKILNKKNQYNLDIYIGNKTDLQDFYFTMEETAARENIKPFSFDYYRDFYTIFNKKNMADLYIAKVKIKDLVKLYENKINEIDSNIKNLEKLSNHGKQENLLKEYINQQNKLIKELKIITEIKKDIITLSSIITVKYGNKVWTVHGGNSNELRELNANYLLYDLIIQDAKKNEYEVIDFFGTTGKDSEDNKIHGIHLFKKRLGGEYTEFIGEFHLITNKLIYFVYTKLIPIYRKLKFKNDKY